jgi:phenylacetate-CoA ligase
MLAVGRALMSSPKLLMLDEPSLGLAPLVVREIFRIIERLRAEGVSILLIEQNARAALEVADHGYVLETGAIALQGPAADLAGDPRVIETYLGCPSSNPPPGDLEPIETASRDELQALQLQRLKTRRCSTPTTTCRTTAAFDAAGVHPSDLKTLADLAKFPFTTKADLRANYPFGMFAVPREQVVRIHASSGTTGKPTVVGYTQGDIDTWATWWRARIRAAGGRAGDIVHVAYGYGLFTGGLGAHYGAERLGCTVVPMSGGQTEKQVQLITDFKPDIIMVTPSYMQVIIEEFRRQGKDPREMSLKRGHLRRRALDRGDAARHRASAGIDAVDIYGLRGDGPGRGQRVHRDQGRPGDLGGPLLPRDHRPRHRRGAARRRGRRAGLHHADQGGAARHPLPHARPDPAAAAHRAQHAPHGQDRRPQRRHADHPRRQRVPDPDRGARAAARQLSGSTSSSSPATACSTSSRCAASCSREHRTGRPRACRARAAAPHQDADRRQHHGERGLPDSIERTLVGKARRVIDKRPR